MWEAGLFRSICADLVATAVDASELFAEGEPLRILDRIYVVYRASMTW